ncbi:MAG: penicillin acylase family protein [Cyclobacteriaceae bacterium]
MKTARFIFTLVITLAFALTLNDNIGSIPPIGKFLSPFHGFWQNAEKEGVNYSEELNLEGLSEPVKIYYDEIRIPHIYAKNNSDLFLVQGYITARDRLWQMDFFSRLVMGRVSEAVGSRARDLDRFNRRIGLKKMTLDQYESIKENPEFKLALNSYSKGVNAYIDQMSYGDYPLEFKFLNYEPEPWTPLKSCFAYALLANTLSRSDADLQKTNLLSLLGRDVFDMLFPDQLGNLDPVIRKDMKWDFEPIQVSKPEQQTALHLTPNTIDQPHPLNGSNNFAVAGTKTKNGHPFFANEPDLELKLPSIWYATHLNAPGKNTMGVTVPGTPLIILGFNDHAAWGVTNSPRDQVDWYSITFKDDSRDEYFYNNQWFKTEKVIEEIKIAGADSYYDTIVYTHHGPVVYDKNFKGEDGKTNYSMKWIAHQSSRSIEAMNKLNTVSSHAEFLEAMRLFHGPPQNILYADNTGDIAIMLPGRFPVKWEEQGKFLLDGSKTEHEWEDYIPFEHMMQDKNPEQGFLSSANQHPASADYPYYVYDHHYEYYRGRRINDRLKELTNITAKDMMQLQNDNFNFMASESLPMMLEAIDTSNIDEGQREFYSKLFKWDYFNDPKNVSASMYQLWWDDLYENLWDEFDTMSVDVNRPKNYVSIHHLKNDTSRLFTNMLSTEKQENAEDLIRYAFENAVDSLSLWKKENGKEAVWYQFKNTSITHMLGLEPLSKNEVKIGGYKGIVNAASSKHGPSWRMVVELDPAGTKAWGVYPGSQTGNPGSPLYGQLIEKWAAGEYYELLFGKNISGSEKVIFTQTAQPK